jgi:hypothetical protein
MQTSVLIEGAESSGNAIEPSRGRPNLAAPGDEFRALLALGLAASLLSVYTVAWATGVVSI